MQITLVFDMHRFIYIQMRDTDLKKGLISKLIFSLAVFFYNFFRESILTDDTVADVSYKVWKIK